MPGGAGRPRRACPICKHYKYQGNSTERRTAQEQARAPQADEWDEEVEEMGLL